MLKNYIKIAWRNLTRHKSYTIINLFGLAVGMACCILIALYVREELSYDTFHEKADHIVAIGTESDYFGRISSTPYPLADVLIEEVPAVKQAVRTKGIFALNLSRDGQTYVEIGGGKYTEPGFFELFSFDLIKGNTSESLAAPNSLVLTERSSKQLFGAENPIGKSLYWRQHDTIQVMEVTGVVKNPPANTTISFEALVSNTTLSEGQRSPDSWGGYMYQTYVLLRFPDALRTLPDHLRSIVENHYEKPEGSEEYRQSFFIMSLQDLHLSELTRDEGFTGNSAYIYLFGSVALFILIIACVNYINLATARSSLRSKEVGVRKTLGAGRRQVAGQFLGESVILCLGAYILGILIALLVLPYFNQMFGTSLEWQSNWVFLLLLFLASLVIGIAAGAYPSVYLSGFSPLSVLRERYVPGGSGVWLRKALVVGQFTIALVLIIGSLVVYRQLQYTQNKDLGFDGEQVVSVVIPSRDWWNRREILRNLLEGHRGIMEVSIANGAPGEFNVRIGQKPEELSSAAQVETDENLTFAPAVVDNEFLNLLDIDLLAGRNFSHEMVSDNERAYILNETGARMLGWTPEEAVGKPFALGDDGEVIGVVQDFHISSLHNEIEGIALQLKESSSWSSSGAILAKLAPDQISSAMDIIREEVAKFSPNSSFNYEFLDDRFDAMYRTERRLGQVVGMFTFIAIVITCLGLYGLATFSTERRVKEIGIRKVLGATIISIVSLLSKDFFKLIVLGFIIAAPVAWYIMNQWLQDFAYRIEIGAGIFLAAGAAALLIALATVSWQSVRAALANPVESLRSE